MSKVDIARALKDKDYFNSLSPQEQAMVHDANPAGESQLTSDELDSVAGGMEGGDVVQATTTTTEGSCGCEATEEEISPGPQPIGSNRGGCSCVC